MKANGEHYEDYRAYNFEHIKLWYLNRAEEISIYSDTEQNWGGKFGVVYITIWDYDGDANSLYIYTTGLLDLLQYCQDRGISVKMEKYNM